MIEIRQTTPSDFVEVCGRPNDKTVKAFTVIRDNEPVAIAGITIEKGRFVAFSDIKEGVTDRKITIWRISKKLSDHLKGLGLPAVATSSNGRFLESIGFEIIGEIDNKQICKL